MLPFPTFNPTVSAGGAATLTYVGKNTGSNYNGTLTMPTLNVGDVIVVFQIADSSGGTTPAAQYGTGFTSLGTNNATYTVGPGSFGVRVCLSYRVAQSGDSGASIGGFMNGNNSECAAIMVWRPSWSGATVTLFNLTNTVTSGDPASQSANASASSELNITFSFAGSVRNGSITNHTTGLTPDDTATANASTISAVSGKALAQGTTSSNMSCDVGDTDRQNFHMSGYLEIT